MTIPAPDCVQAAATAWPADPVERWDIARLTPYVRNARTHSDEQVVMVNGAKVISADIECTAGVIHVVDTVLMPIG